MPKLEDIINNNNTRTGVVFSLFIQMLIVLSLLDFSLETLPGLSPTQRWWLWAFEAFTIAVFTVEYMLRFYVSRPRLKYTFSFFGIIDLLAILPFYLALGFDLRSLRAFRLLRLFRVLKLARYSAAVQRFHIAMKIAWEEMVLFFSASMILLFLTAVGIYYFERHEQPEAFASVFHSLWWATVTLTTVGYGDVYPVTPGGKIFTFFVLFLGLGFISVPAGLVASALGKAREIQQASNSGDVAEAPARR